MTSPDSAPNAGASSTSAGDDERAPLPGVMAVLRDRNFWPYFVGGTLSNHGTWFHNLAQVLLMYRLTGSVLLVGAVNFAQFAGVLLVGPWAGVVADRYDRRRVLILTQSASTVLAAIIAVATWTGHATVWLVLGIAFGLGLCHSIGLPSMLAMVPQLVRPEQLSSAVALNLVTFNAARAVGPVVGAVVVSALGIHVAFAFNVLSFAAFSVALTQVRAGTRAPESVPGSGRPRLRDSARRVASQPALLSLILAGSAVSMAIDPVSTLTPAYVTDALGLPDTVTGWVIGGFGVGTVVAGLTLARGAGSSERALLAMLIALPVCMVAAFSSPALPLTLGVIAVAGVLYMGAVTGAMTRLQLAVEDAEQGRVMALWSIAFMGARPLASLLDGFLAARIGLRGAAVVVVLPTLAAAVYLARSRRSVVDAGRRQPSRLRPADRDA